MEMINCKPLELHKILEMLAGECVIPKAKEIACSIAPNSDLYTVKEEMAKTSQAFELSVRYGTPAFYTVNDISAIAMRADQGGVLSIKELLEIRRLLMQTDALAKWYDQLEDKQTKLNYLFESLFPESSLLRRLNEAIIDENSLSDDASPELRSIRRKIARSQLSIRESLDKMIKSGEGKKYMQDSIVTIRDGRFVIPVKREFKSNVSGLVHDISASGSTLFIEPMSVVEANNDIRILAAQEQDEIHRIISSFSAECGQLKDKLISSYNASCELCVYFAKANLGAKMKAMEPEIGDDGVIILKKARHPLIDEKKVVPIDLEIGTDSNSVLVITGPNTGGKTVVLKTVGLLTLMTMCGLMIPASDGSRVCIYKKVLVDIGDQQSIENDLSTFSSHISTIKRILDEADEKSLVLIDELGAGTDPVEGAALATAILEKLRQQGAKIASTTHYAELKSFALDTKGVENACCEFDVATLRPTYKLLIGMPGRSNAFAISERLGIRSEVVERAKELVSHENTQFESVVQKLEESRHELEQRIAEADALKAEIKAERERMAAAEEEARQKQEKELENARLQAENIITKARAQVYGVLDEIEAIRRKKDVTAEEKAKLKADIRQMEDAADPIHAREQEEYHLPRPLKAGDNVLIFDIDKKAVVLETGKDSVLVQAGIIKTRVPLNNLRLLKEERVTTPKRSVTRTIRSDVKRTASTEVDVRGEVVLDALMDVDRAIDSAVMQGLHQITIIHGKGTGVLRKEIQAHLKKHPSVRSFRLGVFGEGDAGVTIAELK